MEVRGIILGIVGMLGIVSYSQSAPLLRSNPKNGHTFVIAHRGVHQDFPENTLSAYRKAIEIGCDFVEIDLRKTKDGKYVSIHNEDIDAYFKGKTGKVSSFLLSELKQMPLSKKGANNTNEFIPTLEQILQLCKGKIGIYLDLKEADIKELVQIIRKFEMESNIVWYIYPGEKKEIENLKEYCPECLAMPDPGNGKRLKKVLNQIQPILVASDMGQLTRSFVNTSHLKGVKVFTDDDTATTDEWQKIIDWGTDGIQTDQPQKLINFIKSGK